MYTELNDLYPDSKIFRDFFHYFREINTQRAFEMCTLSDSEPLRCHAIAIGMSEKKMWSVLYVQMNQFFKKTKTINFLRQRRIANHNVYFAVTSIVSRVQNVWIGLIPEIKSYFEGCYWRNLYAYEWLIVTIKKVQETKISIDRQHPGLNRQSIWILTHCMSRTA